MTSRTRPAQAQHRLRVNEAGSRLVHQGTAPPLPCRRALRCDGSPRLCLLQLWTRIRIAVPCLCAAAYAVGALHLDHRRGSRPAGVVGVKHARGGMEVGRVLLKDKIAKAEPLGQRSPACPRIVGSHVGQDRDLTHAGRTPLCHLHRRCRTITSILARRPGLVRAVRPHLYRRLARTVRRQGRSAAVDLPRRSAITRLRDRRTGAVAGYR